MVYRSTESITEDSIRDVHKIQNQSVDYEKAIRNIHDRGIMIHASFAYGLDCDNVNTFKDTLDFIVRNRIETVTSHILTPYPGTKFYDRMADEGRIISDDLSLYNTANVVFKPKNVRIMAFRLIILILILILCSLFLDIIEILCQMMTQ